jgi:hypothetical protein
MREEPSLKAITSGGFFTGIAMPSAIEQIVEAYVQLGSRSQLEDLRLHRQRLMVDLHTRQVAGYDISKPLEQLKEDLVAIEAGLAKLKDAK